MGLSLGLLLEVAGRTSLVWTLGPREFRVVLPSGIVGGSIGIIPGPLEQGIDLFGPTFLLDWNVLALFKHMSRGLA